MRASRASSFIWREVRHHQAEAFRRMIVAGTWAEVNNSKGSGSVDKVG